MRIAALVVLGLAGAASAAEAARICVQLDAATDGLGVEEQVSARLMFENALQAARFDVTGTCDETWTLRHVKLGGGVQVLVVTPTGALTAGSTLDQLSTAYEGLVWRGLAMRMQAAAPSSRAPGLEAEQPPATVEPASTITAGSAVPAKSSAGAFYVRIGYAAAPTAAGSNLEPRFGPTIGGGYRRAVDTWLFDVSVLNTHAWRRPDSNDYDANILSFGRIAGYYLLPYDAGSSFYVGGALSFGQSVVQMQSEAGYYGESDTLAIQVEGSAGYEFLQDRSVRVFVEANLIAPLAKVDVYNYGPMGPSPEESHWAPTLQLSAGVGF